jgi:hypothetical protein
MNEQQTELETVLTEAIEQQTEPTEAEPAKAEPNFVMTPYQATKRVNEALQEAGIDKTVRSPMIYIYAGKGAFETHETVKVTKKGTEQVVKEIDEESFLAWMANYVKGAAERATAKVEQVDVAEGEEASGVTTDETASDEFVGVDVEARQAEIEASEAE